MGFTEVLTIVFIVLKLIGIINWSWILVLLPEIIAVLIYLVVILINFMSYRSLSKEVKAIRKRVNERMEKQYDKDI
ncbi:MAG: transmembrane Fragile-X-F protein [Clostridia bacterium]|jgi:hypothetical protein|nr:MAG TPA: hypothetical protein [Caudoviricetes sp.]